MSETKSSQDQGIDTLTAAADSQAQWQLKIDDSTTPVTYSTTARVWGSAEEINIDFAGPIRPSGQQNVARLKIDQRLVMNPWSAKRLAIALGQAVTRYEQIYGPLEIDERKRRVGVPAGGRSAKSGGSAKDKSA